jgi:magnesium chelatase family protein
MQYPVIRYRARISGPLLDRIDIYIEAPALSIRELQNDKPGESSAVIRERIQAARERQLARFAGTKLTANARMSHAQVRAHVPLDAALGEMLQHAMEQLSLSARAYTDRDRAEAPARQSTGRWSGWQRLFDAVGGKSVRSVP